MAENTITGMARCVCGAEFRASVRLGDDHRLVTDPPISCPACGHMDRLIGHRSDPETITLRGPDA